MRRPLAVLAAASALMAQAPVTATAPVHGRMLRADTIQCPADAGAASGGGWAPGGRQPGTLTPVGAHIEGDRLLCLYASPDGAGTFVLSRPLAGRTCAVRTGNTGFQCKHEP